MKPCMLSLFVLMICSIVVRECNADQTPKPPPQECLKRDCPKYDVIYSQKGIEVRSYSQALWASSPTFKQFSVLEGVGQGLLTLLDYYYRGNDKKVNIGDQAPVSLLSVDNDIYTLYFYLPEKYQNGSLPPPKPDDPEVKVVELPKNKFAAVIEGDLTEEVIAVQIDELKRSLQGTPYQRATALTQFSVLLYDPLKSTQGQGTLVEVLILFD